MIDEAGLRQVKDAVNDMRTMSRGQWDELVSVSNVVLANKAIMPEALVSRAHAILGVEVARELCEARGIDRERELNHD